MIKYSVFVLIFFPILFFGQIKLNLISTTKAIEIIDYKSILNFENWSDAEKETKNLVYKLRSEGYLLSNIDSIIRDSLKKEINLFLHIGKKYFWSTLMPGNIDAEALATSGFAERIYSNQVLKPRDFAKLMDGILNFYENNGYPFADLNLQNTILTDTNHIRASLFVNKKRLVTIDSMVVFGNLNVSKKFLSRYLNIKEKSYYNESAINQISSRLKMLPFVVEKRPVLVKLTDKINRLIIFADKRNASQFDGIIGVLPSNTGQIVFTGDLKIKLMNSILRSGETLEINWRRLQTETQDLRTKVVVPFLFNTPFGGEHNLKLYKRDSAFLDVNNIISVNYFFSGLNNFKTLYKQRNAFVLSNSVYYVNSNVLELADVTTRSYGLGFFYESLDYKLNPRKGISISLNAFAGLREISKNPNVSDFYYSGLQLNTSQYQAESEIYVFIPIYNRSTFKVGIQSSTINSHQIFRNELFRIGGLKTLRGFDEESIFSSTYSIGTLEYRFIFEENSCIFLFSDLCWYERDETSGYMKDFPIGIGSGINFQTKAGIFSLTYALGNQLSNGFDFRSGKIHFGVINSF